MSNFTRPVKSRTAAERTGGQAKSAFGASFSLEELGIGGTVNMENEESDGTITSTTSTFTTSSSSSPSLLSLPPLADSSLHFLLQRLLKRDSTTKSKSLDEIIILLREKDEKIIMDSWPMWIGMMERIVSDHDRRVREKVFLVLYEMIQKDKKSLSNHMKKIFPLWFPACFDNQNNVAKAANLAWDAAFPTEDKKKKVLIYCGKTFFAHVNLILTMTPQQMSAKEWGGKGGKEEEEERYERIIMETMMGIGKYFEMVGKDIKERVVVNNNNNALPDEKEGKSNESKESKNNNIATPPTSTSTSSPPSPTIPLSDLLPLLSTCISTFQHSPSSSIRKSLYSLLLIIYKSTVKPLYHHDNASNSNDSISDLLPLILPFLFPLLSSEYDKSNHHLLYETFTLYVLHCPSIWSPSPPSSFFSCVEYVGNMVKNPLPYMGIKEGSKSGGNGKSDKKKISPLLNLQFMNTFYPILLPILSSIPSTTILSQHGSLSSFYSTFLSSLTDGKNHIITALSSSPSILSQSSSSFSPSQIDILPLVTAYMECLLFAVKQMVGTKDKEKGEDEKGNDDNVISFIKVTLIPFIASLLHDAQQQSLSLSNSEFVQNVFLTVGKFISLIERLLLSSSSPSPSSPSLSSDFWLLLESLFLLPLSSLPSPSSLSSLPSSSTLSIDCINYMLSGMSAEKQRKKESNSTGELKCVSYIYISSLRLLSQYQSLPPVILLLNSFSTRYELSALFPSSSSSVSPLSFLSQHIIPLHRQWWKSSSFPSSQSVNDEDNKQDGKDHTEKKKLVKLIAERGELIGNLMRRVMEWNSQNAKRVEKDEEEKWKEIIDPFSEFSSSPTTDNINTDILIYLSKLTMLRSSLSSLFTYPISFPIPTSLSSLVDDIVLSMAEKILTFKSPSPSSSSSSLISAIHNEFSSLLIFFFSSPSTLISCDTLQSLLSSSLDATLSLLPLLSPLSAPSLHDEIILQSLPLDVKYEEKTGVSFDIIGIIVKVFGSIVRKGIMSTQMEKKGEGNGDNDGDEKIGSIFHLLFQLCCLYKRGKRDGGWNESVNTKRGYDQSKDQENDNLDENIPSSVTLSGRLHRILSLSHTIWSSFNKTILSRYQSHLISIMKALKNALIHYVPMEQVSPSSASSSFPLYSSFSPSDFISFFPSEVLFLLHSSPSSPSFPSLLSHLLPSHSDFLTVMTTTTVTAEGENVLVCHRDEKKASRAKMWRDCLREVSEEVGFAALINHNNPHDKNKNKNSSSSQFIVNLLNIEYYLQTFSMASSHAAPQQQEEEDFKDIVKSIVQRQGQGQGETKEGKGQEEKEEEKGQDENNENVDEDEYVNVNINIDECISLSFSSSLQYGSWFSDTTAFFSSLSPSSPSIPSSLLHLSYTIITNNSDSYVSSILPSSLSHRERFDFVRKTVESFASIDSFSFRPPMAISFLQTFTSLSSYFVCPSFLPLLTPLLTSLSSEISYFCALKSLTNDQYLRLSHTLTMVGRVGVDMIESLSSSSSSFATEGYSSCQSLVSLLSVNGWKVISWLASNSPTCVADELFSSSSTPLYSQYVYGRNLFAHFLLLSVSKSIQSVPTSAALSLPSPLSSSPSPLISTLSSLSKESLGALLSIVTSTLQFLTTLSSSPSSSSIPPMSLLFFTPTISLLHLLTVSSLHDSAFFSSLSDSSSPFSILSPLLHLIKLLTTPPPSLSSFSSSVMVSLSHSMYETSFHLIHSLFSSFLSSSSYSASLWKFLPEFTQWNRHPSLEMRDAWSPPSLISPSLQRINVLFSLLSHPFPSLSLTSYQLTSSLCIFSSHTYEVPATSSFDGDDAKGKSPTSDDSYNDDDEDDDSYSVTSSSSSSSSSSSEDIRQEARKRKRRIAKHRLSLREKLTSILPPTFQYIIENKMRTVEEYNHYLATRNNNTMSTGSNTKINKIITPPPFFIGRSFPDQIKGGLLIWSIMLSILSSPLLSTSKRNILIEYIKEYSLYIDYFHEMIQHIGMSLSYSKKKDEVMMDNYYHKRIFQYVENTFTVADEKKKKEGILLHEIIISQMRMDDIIPCVAMEDEIVGGGGGGRPYPPPLSSSFLRLPASSSSLFDVYHDPLFFPSLSSLLYITTLLLLPSLSRSWILPLPAQWSQWIIKISIHLFTPTVIKNQLMAVKKYEEGRGKKSKGKEKKKKEKEEEDDEDEDDGENEKDEDENQEDDTEKEEEAESPDQKEESEGESEDDNEDEFTLRCYPDPSLITTHDVSHLSLNEVSSSLTHGEVSLSLTISLPLSYPLSPPIVKFGDGVKVHADYLRKWTLMIQSVMNSTEGKLIDAILTWRKNVSMQFKGVEECVICYSTLHATSKSLPRTSCPQCKNKFHSECIFKWFNTSGNSKCPLCRSIF